MAIFVESTYEGNTFEHAVSTLSDAEIVRDLKIADGATDVKIIQDGFIILTRLTLQRSIDLGGSK